MENSKENIALLEDCNFSKIVLMLIVVLRHSIAFWTGSWFTNQIERVQQQ